jgi:hypothetical protein
LFPRDFRRDAFDLNMNPGFDGRAILRVPPDFRETQQLHSRNGAL